MWKTVIDDYQSINKVMMEYINNLRKQNPDGIKRSNLMGWHSKNFDLQNHTEPKLFIDKIYPYLKEMNEDMDYLYLLIPAN